VATLGTDPLSSRYLLWRGLWHVKPQSAV
jgi:hypothetical protein